MSDLAHVKTDLKLEEMEKRLSAIYSRAEKEIQQTADEYFSKFAAQDEKKRELLEQGKITEEEYTKWRKGKIMYGKRFAEMKEQCAKQLLNVNQTALAYINGELPEVYAMNYNALESAVDGVGGYSFTLVDADTVRNLAVTDTSLLPYKELDPAKDIPWNMKKINAETLQGILQGESIDKIAKRLRNVQEMNKTQAIRSARTIVTGAENKGRQDSYARATADGIILQKEWLATNDGRTRHSHATLDGAIVDQDKKFENGLMYPGDPSGRPEEVYNCFIVGTKVASDSSVVRSYKHKYNGKIISVKTAGGVQFSCTPNHPILTPRGWVAAEFLNNGDNILVTNGENNVFSRVNPYIKHRFPSIDAIHKLGKKFGGERACGLSVNFHGDISTADVEVVTHKRLLRNGVDSGGGNCINKFLLKLSNKTIFCFGSLFKHFRSVCKTSFCFICCKCKSLPFFKCSVSHSCEHGFGTISNRDSVLTEYSVNDLPADTVIDGELLDRLSCKVFLDTIVNVDVSVLSTHVYNLQTENGYYFVNSIIPQDTEKSNGIFAIAKNCRCTLVAKVNGFKKAQVQKAMAEKQTEIEDAKTISDVETAFRNRDWFIHGEGSLAGWRSDDALSLDGLDVESAKYVYRTYEKFFEKFPQMRGKLAAPVSAKKDRTVYADCMVGFGNGGITINRSRFYDYGKFKKSVSDDFAKGWFSSKDVFMHELGHAMDDFLSVNQHLFGVNGKSRSDFVSHKVRPMILRDSGIKLGDIRTEVSEYATTNQHEWFAEVFAEYMSSENPRKCASSFGKWLEEVMSEVK